MISSLKNYIKTNRFFWQYRHIINNGIWSNYFESHVSAHRNFYSDFADFHSVRGVFEFGCASGPNLKNIQSRAVCETFCFGFDLNKSAIEFAKRKFNSDNTFFTSKLERRIIEETLGKWSLSSFDMAIYDRVLYLLNDAEVSRHFESYGDLFQFIVIDDFHNAHFDDFNESYKSKDYVKILSQHKFHLIEDKKSEHSMNDDFFQRSARRLVFRKI